MSALDALQPVRDRLARAGNIEGVMLFLGAVTGLLTGLSAAVLIWLLRAVQRLAWGGTVETWELLLVPTLGALLVGLWLTWVAPEPGGSGVVRTMETLALRGGRFRARVPAAGIAATSVALGTGASGGREGPIVMIGGSIGSLLGQLTAVDAERMRALIGAGAAAGIGASFNAPIGGMLFAVELILGGLRARSMQVIVVSSVIGSVTARELIGSDITFDLARTYHLGSPWELGLYLLLGLLAAGFGVGFLRLEAMAIDAFTRLRARVWRPLTLALGGLGVGLTALVVPEVLGTGDALPPIDGVRHPVQSILEGGFGVGWSAVGVLLALAAAKTVATMFSIGSGNAVGTFMPALFIGGALGGAFGTSAATLLPNAGIEPAAFGLVGMAAGFSAATRAPLTAILITFELTNDYGLVLPLMLTCGVATYLASLVEPDSIYTHPLRQRGIVFGEPADIDVMEAVSVREVMTRDHPSIRREERLNDIEALFERTSSHGFAVVDGGHRLVGVLTRQDLEGARERIADRQVRDALTADDLCTKDPLVVHPDEPVYTAVQRMAALDIGRIPVVERGSNRVLGVVRRGDVVRAYQQGLNRHLGDQQREATRNLRDLVGVTLIEIAVHPEAPATGRRVREVAWPQRTILTSIRRAGSLVMPTGDTVIEPGDEVVVLTDRKTIDEVRGLLTAVSPAP
jgi:chloride channel protein, CIC family